jgi:phage-related protein
MLNLSAGAIAQKNNIGAASAWIVLLEVQIPTTPTTTLYLTNNNENVTWDGQTWSCFPFDLDPVRENSSNEIPVASIRISNVTRDVLYYLEQAQGAIDFPAIIRVVNSEVLGSATPELELEYIVKRITYDAQYITFTLGGSQHIIRRTPERRYMKDFCPFAYNGVECGIPSATFTAYPTCDKSLAACRTRSNSIRFGGEPGIPSGGIHVNV